MKYIFVTLCFFILLTNPAYAKSSPEFEQYKVPTVLKTKVRKVDLKSHLRAREYRRQLEQAIGKAPNFAGHYVLLTWGCGSPCHEIALVDTRNGKVDFAPFYGRVNELFQPNSRLLILNSPSTPLFGTEYYEWTGSEFRKLNCNDINKETH
jgi:hypothetical protein